MITLGGITPLVFLSGSMSPTINTGDLALSRTVPATELRAGDIISVDTATGTRVTHRITDITPLDAERAQLQLQGDANNTPDEENYEVAEAEKVFTVVPHAGYLLTAAKTPWALLLGGGLVTAALTIGFTPHRGTDSAQNTRSDSPSAEDPQDPNYEDGTPDLSTSAQQDDGRPPGPSGHERTIRRSLALVAVLGLTAVAGAQLPTPAPTTATFTDAATMTTGSFDGASSATLATPTTACTDTASRAVISWNHIDARVNYIVTLTREDGAQISQTTINSTGAPGSRQSYSIPPDPSLWEDQRRLVTVRSVLKAAPSWTSEPSSPVRFHDYWGMYTGCNWP